MPFKQSHPIIITLPPLRSTRHSEKQGAFSLLPAQLACPSSLTLHLACCSIPALWRLFWLRGGQVFQLVVSVPRGRLAARVALFRRQLFIPLALDDLLELPPGVVRFGREHGGGHGEPQDFRDHVGPEPAHQRGAAGGVVGLLVVEEQPVDLWAGEGMNERAELRLLQVNDQAPDNGSALCLQAKTTSWIIFPQAVQ